MHGPAPFEQLRSAYIAAFHELSVELHRLELCKINGNESLERELRQRVSEAEREYHRTRDALAAFLMCKQARAAA